MFNRDITRFFRQADSGPTDDFRTNLRKRVLAERASHIPSRNFTWLRALSVGTASLALAAVVFNATFGPNHSNAVLAEAVQNTFGLSEDGYHHQKTTMMSSYDGRSIHESVEYWQENGRSIMDLIRSDDGQIERVAYYHSAIEDFQCVSENGNAPTCETAQFPYGDPDAYSLTLQIENIHAEATDDTHGDMYLTWVTGHPLTDSTVRISGPSAPGFAYSTWNGTYSWIDEKGRYVNRVTLWVDDILQNPLTPSSSFLVQIVESEPYDGPYAIDANGGITEAPEMIVLGESPVFRIGTGDWTVNEVSDTGLDAIRETTRLSFNQEMVSVDTVRRQYESTFMFVFTIQDDIHLHTLTDEQQIKINGHDVKVLNYSLANDHTVIMGGTPADEAEFAIDQETNTILWFNLFDASGNTLQHVELLIQEERDEAPEGIFDLESWKARVTAQS